MLAAAAARVVELGEPDSPAGAELLGHQPVHGGRRHRRRGVLQLGQCFAVGRGVLVGDGGLVDAQRLAEFHRPALERAEHLEQLLGRAALQFGRDLVAVPAHQPLPEAQRGPPGGGQGQACQARRSAQGAPRDVCHRTIVTKARPGRRAPATAAPDLRDARDSARGAAGRGIHNRDAIPGSADAGQGRRPATPGCR